jgi:hypothetical protein
VASSSKAARAVVVKARSEQDHGLRTRARRYARGSGILSSTAILDASGRERIAWASSSMAPFGGVVDDGDSHDLDAGPCNGLSDFRRSRAPEVEAGLDAEVESIDGLMFGWPSPWTTLKAGQASGAGGRGRCCLCWADSMAVCSFPGTRLNGQERDSESPQWRWRTGALRK